MKIDRLPLGARFQWKGRVYTKVGPMTASAESGGVDFIPKHATLQPVPGEAPPQPPPSAGARRLDATRVMAAFETYHQTALTLAGEAARGTLEDARKRFFEDIG